MKQEAPRSEQLERQVDALFASYREACPEVEPSASFMPSIWARIDAQRGWMWHLKGYAQRMALATAAVFMMLAGLHLGSVGKAESLLAQSYVDVLQDSAATEDYAYVPVLDMGDRSE